MVINMSKFSAFKLFYDQFIYKRNILVHYDKIERNILKIRENVFSMLDTSENDRDLYLTKLGRARTRIKKELSRILEIEPYLFELYFEMYKDRVETNDNVLDLPFIITCSFYEDYKIDGNREFRICRYSSKEKKEIRDEAKSLRFILFFINMLTDRNKEQYSKLIQVLTNYYNSNINMNISYEDNLIINEKEKSSILKVFKRDMNKAMLGVDYDYFLERISIAFKIKDKSLEELLIEQIDECFNKKYQVAIKEDYVLLDSSLYHVISYDVLKDFIRELKEQDDLYEIEYNNKNKITIKEVKFANNIYHELVKYYYDSRIKKDFLDDYSMQSIVAILSKLNSIRESLPDRLLKYILFESSYSSKFNRNNNEEYYVISNIYELYSPYKVLDYYEKMRKELDDVILHLGKEFKNNLEYELIINNINIYPLKTKNYVVDELKKLEHKFIIDNYRDNMISQIKEYDTRDFDLDKLVGNYSIKDLVLLFNDLKIDINDLDIDSKYREELIKQVTYFISKNILDKQGIKYDKNDENALLSLIKDIAFEYLKVNYGDGEVIDTKIRDKNIYEFQILFEEYKRNSSFRELKEKIK